MHTCTGLHAHKQPTTESFQRILSLCTKVIKKSSSVRFRHGPSVANKSQPKAWESQRETSAFCRQHLRASKRHIGLRGAGPTSAKALPTVKPNICRTRQLVQQTGICMDLNPTTKISVSSAHHSSSRAIQMHCGFKSTEKSRRNKGPETTTVRKIMTDFTPVSMQGLVQPQNIIRSSFGPFFCYVVQLRGSIHHISHGVPFKQVKTCLNRI